MSEIRILLFKHLFLCVLISVLEAWYKGTYAVDGVVGVQKVLKFLL